MVEVISSEIFKQEVFDFSTETEWKFDKSTPVIVNFFAMWCGPCHAFAPVLDEVAEAYAGKLRVLKIDIDASPEIPLLFGVRSVPTTLFISAGQEPAIANGMMGFESMQRAIQEQLGIASTST